MGGWGCWAGQPWPLAPPTGPLAEWRPQEQGERVSEPPGLARDPDAPHLSPLPHPLLGGVLRPSGQLGLGLSGRLQGRGGGEECFPAGIGFRLSAEDGSPGQTCKCGCCSGGPCSLRPRTSCCRANGRGIPTHSAGVYDRFKARSLPPLGAQGQRHSRLPRLRCTHWQGRMGAPDPGFLHHARTISQTQTHGPVRLILFLPDLI